MTEMQGWIVIGLLVGILVVSYDPRVNIRDGLKAIYGLAASLHDTNRRLDNINGTLSNISGRLPFEWHKR